MCSVVHPFSGKRDTTSLPRSTSVPQSTGLLDITTAGVLFPEISGVPADIQHEDTSPCRNIASVEVESQSFGSLREPGEAGLSGPEQIKEQDLQKQKELFPVSKPKCRGFGSIESIMVLLEDEDSCPICLEEYDKENPRIDTICEHHYHLGCILEWMERSDNCPMCDQEVSFNESLKIIVVFKRSEQKKCEHKQDTSTKQFKARQYFTELKATCHVVLVLEMDHFRICQCIILSWTEIDSQLIFGSERWRSSLPTANGTA
ncbi:hypothetical protein GOP47_0011063 [Adiantum capillus-veneris]|uniref:RING-type E3 ubiquitin transferase n=1 Tax=Adiantum capillus-veneris TaxID=13818 RepID=A0A9D4US34_ADICA|nr:hypothetical protein GOP47_0011063 [Adiantum capillus-veneris]